MKTPTAPKRQKEKIYGNNIKAILTESGMTQQELTDIVGTNRAHISQIINGKRRCISLSTAMKISKALGQPLEKVFIINESDETED